jgi:glutaredoxin 3
VTTNSTHANDQPEQQPEIVMYTSAGCGYCFGAKQLLTNKGVSFTEIRIDKEPGMRQEMEQRSQRDTVPQIFIGDRHVGGFDDLVELDMDGELDPLLGLE